MGEPSYNELVNNAGFLALRERFKTSDIIELKEFQQQLIDQMYNAKGARYATSFTVKGFNLSRTEMNHLRLDLAELIQGTASDMLCDEIDRQEPEVADDRPIYDQELQRIDAALAGDPQNAELLEQRAMWQQSKINTEQMTSDYEIRQQDKADANDDLVTAQRIGLGVYD